MKRASCAFSGVSVRVRGRICTRAARTARTLEAMRDGYIRSMQTTRRRSPGFAPRLAGEGRLGPRAERLVRVELALERDHNVARVLREALDVVKRRDDEALRLREEREDGERRRAAVVDLDQATARLLLLGLLGEDVERLVEVEEDLRAVALDRPH